MLCTFLCMSGTQAEDLPPVLDQYALEATDVAPTGYVSILIAQAYLLQPCAMAMSSPTYIERKEATRLEGHHPRPNKKWVRCEYLLF